MKSQRQRSSFFQEASLATMLSFSGVCFAFFVFCTTVLVLALEQVVAFSSQLTFLLVVVAVASASISLAAMQLWKTRVFDPLVDLDNLIRSDLAWNLSVRSEISGIAEISRLQRSFNELLEKIQESNEIKAEFLSTVSHELRTPLTAISGYVKVLEAEEAGSLNETQKEFLQIVDVNVSRLGKLINDILDVEKMDSGKFEIAHDPQSLASVLTECKNTFEVVAREKELRLEFRGLEQDQIILGERDRLVQVFANLLSNAIKYTAKGSIAVTLSRDGSMAVVRVQDTGPGLSEDQRLELFHKFRRLRNESTRAEGGTGLGLVIVQGLVQAHGGTIEVQGEPGRGSAFIVRLPLFVETSADSDGVRKRVLLYEQKRDLALLIRRALELQGFTVDLAENLGGIISRIEQNHSYDVVVLSGDEPLKLLRKMPQGLALPVCVLTEEDVPQLSTNDRVLYLQRYQSLDRLVEQVMSFVEKQSGEL